MNKKTLFLASLCVIGLCTWEAQAVTTKTNPVLYELTSLPHGFEDILLKGDLLLGIGPNAIEAGASDDAVYIQFNQSFGNVNISIYNGNGLVVYSTVVDTSVQEVVIIPITTAVADSFTVVLENANGYAEGDFDRD